MGSVSLDGVRKVYDSEGGGILAVDDLDIDIEDGEFLVLVGPSGCGKSTTLRMIAGLEDITEGEIRIGGTVVNDKEPKERDIAMVFQNYALYPHMTVRENIGFGLKYSSNLSQDAIEERTREAAEMMGIEDLLDDTPEELSGGQRQRVALGRAIVREPEVFLFDEPLSNLDAKLRTHMRTEITRLQTEVGVTSVYVTHDQAEAMTMGDKIAVLDGGELQQLGSPNEVYDHPANEFVAGFIGSPSMNFMATQLVERDDGYHLVSRLDDSLSYALDDEVVAESAVAVGEELTLGVRPEDLHVVRDASEYDSDRLFEATVDVVEPMGSDNFISLDVVGDEPWVARVDPSYNPERGVAVTCTFDQGMVNLFDAEGNTLKSRGTGTESYHERAENTLEL
ncbi:MAG: ABC transporter ATP-binding protein [Haloplanus sp.]